MRSGSWEDVTTQAVRDDVKALQEIILPPAVQLLESKPVLRMVPAACIYKSGYSRMNLLPLADGQQIEDVSSFAADIYMAKAEHLKACAVLADLGDTEFSAIIIAGDHIDGPLFNIVIPWDRDAGGKVTTAPSPLMRPGSWSVFS